MKIINLLFILTISLFSLELKIASYNVDNLFDDIDNGTEYKEYKLNRHNWNSITFKKKVKNITKVICELNADVVGLQEIENKRALEVLQNSLNRAGCKYRYSAITNKRGSSIQVALLSKIKIKKSSYIRVSNFKRDRDILDVVLDTKPKLRIFVNHWRSKRASESQRLKYAKALVKYISKLPKDSEYIILGDFNSQYNECVNLEDKFNDTNNSCGIDTILKTYYKGSLIGVDDSVPFGYHYNLWSELEPHSRWSHSFYGLKGAIDSIIIPPSLIDKKGWYYKRGSFNVFKKRFLFKNRRIFRWEYRHLKHTGYGYSDHLPIYAIFSNNAKEESKDKYETFLDKFWRLFIPKKEENSKKILNKTKKNYITKKDVFINDLAKIKSLDYKVLLKEACVVFKRGDIGVIKSSIDSKPITLYKCAEPLKEGKCYNLEVLKKIRYFKIDEITQFKIKKVLKSIDTDSYIKEFNIDKLDSYIIGDIVKNIRGIYKNRYLKINNTKIRLFSKVKTRGLFKKNSKLYIKKAQIGYYKGEKELIVYSLKDIVKE